MGRKGQPPIPGGIFVVDKPGGMTSHDVVSKVRRALKIRRVGHAGTLDPMATGVLVVAFGQATKLVPWLTADDKIYDATVRLGTSTDTLDAEGRVLESAAVPQVTRSGLEEAIAPFLGEYDQVAPKVSAIKIDGRALHKRVRDGEDVKPPSRRVALREVTIQAIRGEELDLRVHSGKGFYVRSFARDLSQKLGTLGHLSMLRRVASGLFRIEDAIAIDEVETGGELSLHDAALRLFRRYELSSAELREVGFGRAIAAPRALLDEDDARPVALTHAEHLVAITETEGESLKILRGFQSIVPKALFEAAAPG